MNVRALPRDRSALVCFTASPLSESNFVYVVTALCGISAQTKGSGQSEMLDPGEPGAASSKTLAHPLAADMSTSFSWGRPLDRPDCDLISSTGTHFYHPN